MYQMSRQILIYFPLLQGKSVACTFNKITGVFQAQSQPSNGAQDHGKICSWLAHHKAIFLAIMPL